MNAKENEFWESWECGKCGKSWLEREAAEECCKPDLTSALERNRELADQVTALQSEVERLKALPLVEWHYLPEVPEVGIYILISTPKREHPIQAYYWQGEFYSKSGECVGGVYAWAYMSAQAPVREVKP